MDFIHYFFNLKTSVPTWFLYIICFLAGWATHDIAGIIIKKVKNE